MIVCTKMMVAFGIVSEVASSNVVCDGVLE